MHTPTVQLWRKSLFTTRKWRVKEAKSSTEKCLFHTSTFLLTLAARTGHAVKK